jgi:hypothetical protein
MTSKVLVALAAFLTALPAQAATVCVSGLLPSSIDVAWAKIRDFGSHSIWIEGHPDIVLEDGSGTMVGVKRVTTFKDGTRFDEILTHLDDRHHSIGYDVIGDLPIPAYDVHGTIRLTPISIDGRTVVERCLTYDTTLGRAEAEAFRVSREQALSKSLELLAAELQLPSRP